LWDLARWTNGLAFRTLHFSETGSPVIKIAELKAGITEQTRFTRQDLDPKFRVVRGDMLFSWSGNPDTSIDVFRWDGPDGWLNQHIFRVEPALGVDADFLFYLLKSMQPVFARIASNKQTTGLGHVTAADLRSLRVGLPDMSSQRERVCLLRGLDDKIEVNRRISQTLEEIARALFKSWFVDFDPVRGTATVPEDIRRLFPDRLVDSRIGPIPEGWEVGEFGALVDCVREQVNPKALDAGTPYVGLEHVPKRRISLAEWGSAASVDSGKSRFREGDVLFGKLRPYFHKVVFAPISGICSTDILVLRPRQKFAALSLMWASSEAVVAHADATSSGTRMPRASWRDLAAYPVPIPPTEVVAAFDGVVHPILDATVNGVHESKTLAELRDTLLPKLISGEVRLEEVS
jgi:type I restriction enzyme S subunit